jgi:integrase
VIRYKRHGQTISETVGWFSEGITPEYCAQLRGQIRANIRTGRGFQSLEEKRRIEADKAKVDKALSVTLGQAFEQFMKTRTLKVTTLREYVRSMNTAFLDWREVRIVDITRDMVSKRHQRIKDDTLKNFLVECRKRGRTPTTLEQERAGAAQANLHMRFLRSLLNFAAGFYEDAGGGPLIKDNPVMRLSQTKAWYRVTRRTTIIKPDQLPAWFQAVLSLESETGRDYLLFLFLTGCRRDEAMTLPLDNVDLPNRAFTLIDPKSRRDITLPIPAYLFGVLKHRIESLRKMKCKYLFPGTDKTGTVNPEAHLVEPKAQRQKVERRSGVSFTLHDLRRLYITTADGLDLSGFAIKRLVSHSVGSDVTGGYVVSDVERLREPAQKIEDRLLRMAGAMEAGKIVPIKRA